MPLRPTDQQIRELSQSDMKGPVVMLNLLKFEKTEGRGSYASYGEGIRPILERSGARVLWQGRCDSVVIGAEADSWDAAILVEYPSRSAFLEMVSQPEYTEVSERRTRALVDSRLIACTEMFRLSG